MIQRFDFAVTLASVCLLAQFADAQNFRPEIPRVWEDAEISSLEVPLATPAATPRHLSAEAYYGLPVRTIYRSYAIYAPGREPQGYFHSLETREPEIVFDRDNLNTEQDWVRAGERVFDAPLNYDRQVTPSDVQDPAWWKKMQMKVLSDGTLPYLRYVVRQKGRWRSETSHAPLAIHGSWRMGPLSRGRKETFHSIVFSRTLCAKAHSKACRWLLSDYTACHGSMAIWSAELRR